MQKILKLQGRKELSNSRIVASKRHGNNVVFLTEADGSFILSFGEIISNKNGTRLKIIARKALTIEEVKTALITIFNTECNIRDECKDTVLLEVPKQKAKSYEEPKKVRFNTSPYFSLKDIFLGVQMTRAPNRS